MFGNNLFGSDGRDELEKIHHIFSTGDRVVVHAPNHHTHGHSGVITEDRDDSHLEVLLHSGDRIRATASELIPESLAPVAEEVKILRRAFDSNTVSVPDRVRIEVCLQKLKTGNYQCSPFPGDVSYGDPATDLRIYAEKYASAADGNVFAKRASGFRVGDRVVEKTGGRLGTVISVSAAGVVGIEMGPGRTMFCVASEVAPA